MNDLIVKDRHYLKNSEEFLSFVGSEVPRDMRDLCQKADEFLKLKAFSYARLRCHFFESD